MVLQQAFLHLLICTTCSWSVSGSTPSSPAASDFPVPCGVPRELSAATDAEPVPAAPAAAARAAEAHRAGRAAAPGAAGPRPGASGEHWPGLGAPAQNGVQGGQ